MTMINNLLQRLSKMSTTSIEATPDILLLQFTIVTACIVGNPKETKDWVLVDTGLENSADFIKASTEKLFGENAVPKAIILTHGHFDHIGSVIQLAEHWNVPVYAHPLELPYITGKKDYPTGDSTVDGGMVAELSPYFPHKSINLGHYAVALPKDGTVPGMPDWRWVHTPGHTPGHISLFRKRDGTLIVGDAFTTVKQESMLSVLSQKEQISGPPAYLTTDWDQAEKSIHTLAALKPSLAILSHGLPMKGEELTRHLEMLVHHFSEIAIPEHGRFVDKQ